MSFPPNTTDTNNFCDLDGLFHFLPELETEQSGHILAGENNRQEEEFTNGDLTFADFTSILSRGGFDHLLADVGKLLPPNEIGQDHQDLSSGREVLDAGMYGPEPVATELDQSNAFAASYSNTWAAVEPVEYATGSASHASDGQLMAGPFYPDSSEPPHSGQYIDEAPMELERYATLQPFYSDGVPMDGHRADYSNAYPNQSPPEVQAPSSFKFDSTPQPEPAESWLNWQFPPRTNDSGSHDPATDAPPQFIDPRFLSFDLGPAPHEVIDSSPSHSDTPSQPTPTDSREVFHYRHPVPRGWQRYPAPMTLPVLGGVPAGPAAYPGSYTEQNYPYVAASRQAPAQQLNYPNHSQPYNSLPYLNPFQVQSIGEGSSSQVDTQWAYNTQQSQAPANEYNSLPTNEFGHYLRALPNSSHTPYGILVPTLPDYDQSQQIPPSNLMSQYMNNEQPLNLHATSSGRLGLYPPPPAIESPSTSNPTPPESNERSMFIFNAARDAGENKLADIIAKHADLPAKLFVEHTRSDFYVCGWDGCKLLVGPTRGKVTTHMKKHHSPTPWDDNTLVECRRPSCIGLTDDSKKIKIKCGNIGKHYTDKHFASTKVQCGLCQITQSRPENIKRHLLMNCRVVKGLGPAKKKGSPPRKKQRTK